MRDGFFTMFVPEEWSDVPFFCRMGIGWIFFYASYGSKRRAVSRARQVLSHLARSYIGLNAAEK
jgi:hypothetical protein